MKARSALLMILLAASSATAAPAQRPDPSFDIAAREREIIGQVPRVAPLRPEELSPDVRKMVNDLRAAASLPPSDVIPEVMATLLKHPDLYAAHMQMGLQLLGKGVLAPRDRELAVLRVGWLSRAPYEWGEHVGVGKRIGLTSAEIERVTRGSKDPAWTEHDRAILRAVEELHANAMISDRTWATLAKRLNEKQLIELPMLVGQYQLVAYYQNSLRMRLMEGNAGLKAR